MLSQCREFNVSITAATQYLDDLDPAMQRALLNNTLTKVVFTPGASEDLNTFTTIMNGLSKDDLSNLGKYRPAVQLPAEKTLPPAKVVDTYPPWSVDPGTVEERKEKLLEYGVSESHTGFEVDLGDGANAGSEKHTELLTTAKEQLEERGLQVDLLEQDAGDDKPDGHVHLPNGEVAHLEAEHGTLSKPAKALQNLVRAVEHGRESIFVVEEGNTETLQNILSDPVNRNGNQHSDENGRFDYYTDQGEPFTEIGQLENAEYRILEATENGLTLYDEQQEETDSRDSEQLEEDRKRFEEVREIDHTVLTCIKKGRDDTQKITSYTGFPNYKVSYSFDKLEELELVHVEKPEQPVERVIDGQKQVFEVKVAELTAEAGKYFDWTDR
jgi:hypothetical protein